MARIMTISSLILAIVASCAGAVDVRTCEEFAAVDRKTETEVAITAADFSCDEYTRLSIRTDMVLKSTVGKVTFSNLALKVYGSLTVEPDVVFTGVALVGKSGGAFKLALGAVVVFKGTADFNGNSIVTTESGTLKHKGGAIHNKGSLTFEKDATFAQNHNVGADFVQNDDVGDYSSGPGGAMSVHVKGSVHFMGSLNVTGNTAEWDGGGGLGGAIHNRGDIIVDGRAEFNNNEGSKGGAIYQEKWATAVFNDFATFTSNECTASYGGAVANYGGEFTFEGGSLFFNGGAHNSGDGGYGGGIYNENGGVVTLKGSTTFRNNFARWGGGIFNRLDPFETQDEPDYQVPVIVYPEDTVFDENYGEFCLDVAYAMDEDTCGL